MAVSTLMPGPKQTVQKGSQFGKLLPAIGTVVGGVAGTFLGPGAGTLAGASAGAALGGTLAGLGQAAMGDQIQDKIKFGPRGMGVSNDSSSAMQRRQAIAQEDPLEQLRRANYALDASPKEIQDAYRKPLQEAMALARKQNEMGMV